MKLKLLDEVRLYICELLLKLILRIVPENTENGLELIKHIKQYSRLVFINEVKKWLGDKE